MEGMGGGNASWAPLGSVWEELALSAPDVALALKAALGLIVCIGLAPVVRFLHQTWTVRSTIAKYRRQGKHMPPWNPLLGHLLAAKDAVDELPPNAAGPYVINRLAEKYAPQGAYYLDTWPISTPLLIVTDVAMANQVVNHPWTGVTKPDALLDWFKPISDGHTLITQNGAAWRQTHAMLAPAFSSRNLNAAAPALVRTMAILRDRLRGLAAAGELFRLEPLMLAMLNDVTGRFVFNAELGAQAKASPLTERMIRQLSLTFSNHNPNSTVLSRLNPMRWFEMWNNGRLLNRHIEAQVHARVEALRARSEQGGQGEDDGGFRCLLDVILEDYFAQPGHDTAKGLDAAFVAGLNPQLRGLFFAGYDSTSTAIVANCYTIWRHPEVLAKVRAEHDAVFGTDPAAAAQLLAENPALLNALPYTAAVIRETLRLFPPANALREGCRDLVLRGADGVTEFPTEGCGVQINHLTIQHDERYWVRPREFLPERYLVEPGHELHPPRGAWRTFEWGPRNCIGQAKVVREVKTFLVLVVREFDVRECYDEADAAAARTEGGAEAEAEADGGRDLTNVFGEKAYLTEAGAAHLRDWFPCRVSLSNYGQ